MRQPIVVARGEGGRLFSKLVMARDFWRSIDPAVRFHQLLILDRGMPVSVNLQTVHPRKLAAVRREVAPGAVGWALGPAL
jgi:hypothetical protein